MRSNVFVVKWQEQIKKFCLFIYYTLLIKMTNIYKAVSFFHLDYFNYFNMPHLM